MNIHIQRKIDRIIGVPLCHFFSLLPKGKPPASAASKPENILVILLSEMGSLVLAYPMLKHLQSKFPKAALNVLAFERNREVIELLGVFENSRILSVDDSAFMRMTITSIATLRKIRQLRIDTVIDCELFSRISSIYSFLSGAAVRVGFHPHTQEGLYRGDFINRPVLYNPYLHMSQQFINLAEAVTAESTPTVKRQTDREIYPLPVLNIPSNEIKDLKRRLLDDFPDISLDRLILMYPGGGLLPIRAWPIQFYKTITTALIDSGFSVAIIGLSNDYKTAEQIVSCAQNPKCVNMTGYTKSVRELIIVFQLSRLLITNDGGPGHFAALTQTPSIILFGPETPVLYGPLSNLSYCLYSQLSCSPCLTAYNHRNSPCDGENVCLQSITPESVLEKAYEILQ